MKSIQACKSVLLLITLMLTQAALAITPAEEEAEKKCTKPKFRDFVPAPKSEVAPESVISFHINRFADREHVAATAKNLPMKVEVVDKKTFYYVKAKLPAELREGFARIHVVAKSIEGDCIGQDGWLIKVVDKTASTARSGEQVPAAANETAEAKPESSDQ